MPDQIDRQTIGIVTLPCRKSGRQAVKFLLVPHTVLNTAMCPEFEAVNGGITNYRRKHKLLTDALYKAKQTAEKATLKMMLLVECYG